MANIDIHVHFKHIKLKMFTSLLCLSMQVFFHRVNQLAVRQKIIYKCANLDRKSTLIACCQKICIWFWWFYIFNIVKLEVHVVSMRSIQVHLGPFKSSQVHSGPFSLFHSLTWTWSRHYNHFIPPQGKVLCRYTIV